MNTVATVALAVASFSAGGIVGVLAYGVLIRRVVERMGFDLAQRAIAHAIDHVRAFAFAGFTIHQALKAMEESFAAAKADAAEKRERDR